MQMGLQRHGDDLLLFSRVILALIESITDSQENEGSRTA